MSNEWEKVEMAPAWNGKDPETGKVSIKKGDIIEGIYLGMEIGVGPNNSKMYNVRTSDGVKSVWGSTILDSRMKNVKEGEELKIEYLGLFPSEKVKGRSYHKYDVFHREAKEEGEASLD